MPTPASPKAAYLASLPPIGGEPVNQFRIVGTYYKGTFLPYIADLKNCEIVAHLAVYNDLHYFALLDLEDGEVVSVTGALRNIDWTDWTEPLVVIIVTQIERAPEEYCAPHGVVDFKIEESPWVESIDEFVGTGICSSPDGEPVSIDIRSSAVAQPIGARIYADRFWLSAQVARFAIDWNGTELAFELLGYADPCKQYTALLAQAEPDPEPEPESEPTKRPARVKISSVLRRSILERDGFRCVDCGASPSEDPWVTLEIDHRIPVSKGGGNDPENLQVLCRECNNGKRDKVDHKIAREPVAAGRSKANP